MDTYYLLGKAGAVGLMNDCVEKVVRVTLALILQLLEEVQQPESERSGRSVKGRREPTGTEDLDVGFDAARQMAAFAIPDDDPVNAAQVEDHEVTEGTGM